MFKCSSSQNRSTPQQPDPRTLPDQPTVSSNKVADGAFQSSVGQHGMLHSSVDSSCFTNWTPSTSSVFVARMTHPRSHVQRPSTCPLLASVPPRLPQPMTNSQVSALCPRQLARHVHAVSSCALVWLTERWVCALAPGFIVPPVHSISPKAYLTKHRGPDCSTREPPSHQASSLDASRGSPSLVLVPVSSPAVPADGCGCFGCTSPCVSCVVPPRHSRYSFRDGGHDMK